jgi:dienelactone hydrolase
MNKASIESKETNMKFFFIFLLTAVSMSAGAAGTKFSYDIDGKKYEGYLATPTPGAPLIFLIHDWDGLTDYEVKRSEMLATLGYSVFALDLFGAGVRPVEVSVMQQLTTELYKDRKKMLKLLQSAYDIAKSKGLNVDNAVAMGYCFGGAAALEFARSGVDLKGFVTFHGGLTTPEGQDYSKTKGKLLILHGSADKFVSLDEFAKLAAELEAKGVSHEMITYSGAPHAFTVFGAESYREDADRKSWLRFTEYLKETLGK